MITVWILTDSEHLLSGQLDELASDVTVLVFETDEIPCRDIVRLVYRSSNVALFSTEFLNSAQCLMMKVRLSSRCEKKNALDFTASISQCPVFIILHSL